MKKKLHSGLSWQLLGLDHPVNECNECYIDFACLNQNESILLIVMIYLLLAFVDNPLKLKINQIFKKDTEGSLDENLDKNPYKTFGLVWETFMLTLESRCIPVEVVLL